ncbi:hypothetical protein Tco_1470773 [Tanacetum coccineum]
MPFPRFTKVIINHFLSQHKSLSMLKFQHYHIIKDDGIVSRLKFVRIGEDYQEYGLPIPEMMLNDKIKQSESYQMFIKYSTVDVSDESEPEHAKKKTGSRSTRGVVIQDTPKQEATDTMQALKDSKKTNRRQPGTGTKLGVPDEEKVNSEVNVILEWGSENKSEHLEDSQLNSDEEEKKDNDGD